MSEKMYRKNEDRRWMSSAGGRGDTILRTARRSQMGRRIGTNGWPQKPSLCGHWASQHHSARNAGRR